MSAFVTLRFLSLLEESPKLDERKFLEGVGMGAGAAAGVKVTEPIFGWLRICTRESVTVSDEVGNLAGSLVIDEGTFGAT